MQEWNIKEVSKEKILNFSKKWSIPEVCSAILISRGIENEGEIKEFLGIADFLDPFEFTDMQKAVEIIEFSLKNNEKICVYGDYDADGITATALLYSYFKSKNSDVIYYIPSRDNEGYGLNISAIKKLFNEGVNLLVTVDNGISAYEEIKFAKELGMKVIITDHHKLPQKLPIADATINPCRETWFSKEKNFAGVGVAYKLVQAIEKSEDYLEFATLGTISDSMPLFGQSRRILKKGVKSIFNSKIVGINTLLNHFNLNSKIPDSVDIAFKIIPKINASGRIQLAETALKLLVSKDKIQCEKICLELENLNNLRKSIEKEIFESVEKKLKENPKIKFENIIIVEGENWHHGVIGIVAAKIAEKYLKPCILISYVGEQARGSCRSVEGFSIYDIVSSCSEHLEKFGGHTAAAGINLATYNVKKFSKSVLENSKNLKIETPKLLIDLKLDFSSFSKKTLSSLDYLKPFGSGNPEPIFCICNAKLQKIFLIGKGAHLKLTFSNGNKKIDMMYFRKTQDEFLYQEGDCLDVAFTLHPDFFRPNTSVSAHIVDLKLTNENIKTAIKHKKIYEKFKRGEILEKSEKEILIPSREEFAKIYRYLLKANYLRPDILSFKVFHSTDFCGKAYIILDVLEEMELISTVWCADEVQIQIKKTDKKVNLENSKILSVLKEE